MDLPSATFAHGSAQDDVSRVRDATLADWIVGSRVVVPIRRAARGIKPLAAQARAGAVGIRRTLEPSNGQHPEALSCEVVGGRECRHGSLR